MMHVQYKLIFDIWKPYPANNGYNKKMQLAQKVQKLFLGCIPFQKAYLCNFFTLKGAF